MSCSLSYAGFGFAQEDIARAVREHRLLSMEVEFGRSCNFRCPYCYVAESAASQQAELTVEELQNGILQARDLGARKIIILGGEPLVYPHLRPMIDFIHGLGLEMELFTNGSKVTPELAAFFFARGVKVVIKLNSFDPALQAALTGHPQAFELIHTSLANLKAAGYPADGRGLAASTVICRQNLDELPRLWVWLRDQGIDPYVEMITPQGRSKANDWLMPDLRRIEPLFAELARIDRERYGREWEPQPPLASNKCLRNQFSCVLDAYGNVSPCVGVTLHAGNIRTRKLQDIIRDSDMFKDLRNFHGAIKGPCGACDKAESCYGCRGAAYQLTGDYLASDPLCWRNLDRLDQIITLPTSVNGYLPQEAPMRLVEHIASMGDGEAEVETTVRESWPFLDPEGNVLEAAHIELVAQSIAAFNAFRTTRGAGPGLCGMLVGASDFSITGKARTGDRLKVRIRSGMRFGEYSLVSGTILREDEVIASGEIRVWEKTNTP